MIDIRWPQSTPTPCLITAAISVTQGNGWQASLATYACNLFVKDPAISPSEVFPLGKAGVFGD